MHRRLQMETSTDLLLAKLTPAEQKRQHQSHLPPSPETTSQNAPMTTDVCIALTTQLCLNKLATALLLLLYIWEGSTNHFMYSLCMTCRGKLFVKITNCDFTETQGGQGQKHYFSNLKNKTKQKRLGKHKTRNKSSKMGFCGSFFFKKKTQVQEITLFIAQ